MAASEYRSRRHPEERGPLALLWGGRALAPHGWAGRLKGAYLAPRTGQVTHLLVQRGPLRTPAPFPLSGARQAPGGELVLAQGQESEGPRRGSLLLSPERALRRPDGPAAPLSGLIVDGAGRSILYLLARYRGQTRAIPMGLVKNLASGSPSMDLYPEEFQSLPTYLPQREALESARAALSEADPTGRTFARVGLDVRGGTVFLSGNARLPSDQRDAEEAVRRAPGILAVEGHITSDYEIELAVARAVAQAGLMRRGLVLVKSSLGQVTLRGTLPSQDLVDQAANLASAVPGVRQVTQEVSLKAPRAEAELAATPAARTDAPQG